MLTSVPRPAAVIVCLVVIGLAGCGGKTRTVTVVTTPSPSSGARVYRVPSGSMAPTLPLGSGVVVQPQPPKVGDIIVFFPPDGASQQQCGTHEGRVKLGGAACAEPVPKRSNFKFIKRIVAGPGDELYISEGHVFRRAAGSEGFVREDDSYIRPCSPGNPDCNFPQAIKIPAGDWFTLGDNRGESDDSRFWGPVPTGWIEGVVTARTAIGPAE